MKLLTSIEPWEARREPTVVHLTAECWPFAYTGGLGMAVSGLARSQAAAGLRTMVVTPLYRSVWENGISTVLRRMPLYRSPWGSEAQLEPLGPPFPVRLGPNLEPARLWHLNEVTAGPRVVFIEHEGFFGRGGIYGESDGTDYRDNHRRFAFFVLAALRALPQLAPGSAVLHAHDWHTALAPVYLRTMLGGTPYYDAIPAILSVHNAAFQGRFESPTLAEIGLANAPAARRLEWHGGINWLNGALALSDLVTTVSPTHAGELRTPPGGFGLHETFCHLGDRLHGVLNGIEPDLWNPAIDSTTAARYSADEPAGKAQCKAALQRECGLPVRPGTPLVAMCARLVEQKGLDLVLNGPLESLLETQFLFLGRGEERYESALRARAAAVPDRIAVETGFSVERERRLLAGADLLLMPSLYEPCGLTQMRAQRYGTIPVARRVGGLADTIRDGVTGFLFDDYAPEALNRALDRALERYRDPVVWSSHVSAAMAASFGWERSAGEYRDLYARALQSRVPASGQARRDPPRRAQPPRLGQSKANAAAVMARSPGLCSSGT